MSSTLLQKGSGVLSNDAVSQILEYLDNMLRTLNVGTADRSESTCEKFLTPDQGAEETFGLLTHRKYCYLSKRRAGQYRVPIVDSIRNNIIRQEPLRFFYDIGGGYHASIRPNHAELGFTVGLAELFILSQISSFQSHLLGLYPPGARFSLVVDNLCAFFVNDIPVQATEAYCASLKQLISELGLQENVNVLVESEQFSTSVYQTRIDNTEPPPSFPSPSLAETENVSRFLGRPCSRQEAATRIAMYEAVTAVSESHLSKITNGVRMTQRASKSTISFRPFPGGDSRIQAGKVALTMSAKGKIKPLLITSKNAGNYVLLPFTAPDSFPPSIHEFSFAVET